MWSTLFGLFSVKSYCDKQKTTSSMRFSVYNLNIPLWAIVIFP